MALETTSSTWIKKTLSYNEEPPVENVRKVIENIPHHLKRFVVEQDYANYTPLDHAVWRYSLRQLKNYLSLHAHEAYLDGLEKTGITIESIPSIDQICAKLQEFGWSAVPVSGFIPPAAFMELQSLGVLPIASDMRSIDHILYTPAPDIVHEAAGHAPILVDPDFAAYLKKYAKVAKHALISKEDLDQYEAIRVLSDTKENPASTPEEIQKAEEELNRINKNISFVSEAALLGRMNWWTAEYGLIGDIENPKIYGAGLLSSYGEASDCLSSEVKKIPLTVDCIKYSYDITEPQPQLFVAQKFTDLGKVLDELAERLAYKRGGIYGLEKAIEAQTVNTVQLNSGLQISGKLVDFIKKEEQCIYFRFEGPSQLCIGGHELPGHDKDFHSHGFSSPLGRIKGFSECLSWASEEDLESLGIIEGRKCILEFMSGVKVSGKLTQKTRTPRRELCLLSFKNCTVTYGDKVLFDPSWGTFDMAVGSFVNSVFAGPSDRKSYGLTDSFAKKIVPPRLISTDEHRLFELYQRARNWRNIQKPNVEQIQALLEELDNLYQEDWLLRLEVVELIHKYSELKPLLEVALASLEKVQEKLPEKSRLIEDGLALATMEL